MSDTMKLWKRIKKETTIKEQFGFMPGRSMTLH